MSLPSHLNDEANLHAGVLVSSAETVNNEQLLVAQLLLCNFLYCSPSLLGSTVVVVLVFLRSPPYCVVRILVVNDELVLRRTAGVDTSHHVYGAELSLLTYLEPLETFLGLLVEQHLIRRIVQNLSSTCDSILL